MTSKEEYGIRELGDKSLDTKGPPINRRIRFLPSWGVREGIIQKESTCLALIRPWTQFSEHTEIKSKVLILPALPNLLTLLQTAGL